MIHLSTTIELNWAILFQQNRQGHRLQHLRCTDCNSTLDNRQACSNGTTVKHSLRIVSKAEARIEPWNYVFQCLTTPTAQPRAHKSYNQDLQTD